MPVLVAVASGSEDLTATLLEKFRALRPDLPLFLVSEFQEPGAQWIPYRPGRTMEQNLAAVRSALKGEPIAYVAMILQPRMPYWTMRALAWQLGGLNTIFFNENLDHFMLRPRSLPTIARHAWWRTKNFVRWETRPGGATYTALWRLAHPASFVRPWRYRGAVRALERVLARRAQIGAAEDTAIEATFTPGISVVVPSRNGRELLARLLPGLSEQRPDEIIVVDNGSDDGTAAWLGREWPAVRVEVNREPLSFARAVNRGIHAARCSHVLMLNNDMVVEPGFLAALRAPFDTVPNLFCSTAQIFFPAGARRQETGKAVMPETPGADDFPVTCVEPIEGEDHTYVMDGSGGCSLFNARKLRRLGGLLETYEPAYVEDLDLGFRGWQRGWPTVFAAGARVEHRHRSTTSRYYSESQLAQVLEVNLLKFIAGTVTAPAEVRRLWMHTLGRLNRRAARMEGDVAALNALTVAGRDAVQWVRPAPRDAMNEAEIFAIGSGEVAVFPGGQAATSPPRPVLLVASPYLPFPLTHGGAVRMYNLLRRASRDFDLGLLCFADQLATPPAEALALCRELLLVRREGRHDRPLTARPDTVEEFDTAPFHAALNQALRKWRPAMAQLEYTQMAVYAKDCAEAGARTVLVEHDVTYDLYEQMLRQAEDWETRQQYERWVAFEKQAWRDVDAVVVMSEKDRAAIAQPHAVTLANGVDLERFTPSWDIAPEPRRILFIGAFSHLPNLLALEFFLRDAWPHVRAAAPDAVLHVIAGKNHRYFLDRAADRCRLDLTQPGIEAEDFVSDPRIAYRRAEVVIAPLLASAGTNIKIMEAMAMGRAVVSTPGGINGLNELRDGYDVVVRETGEAMAQAIADLFAHPARRKEMERAARASAERWYGWDAIAARQLTFYRRLMGG
ncbi:MAG: glycosyltransferase [Bryobacterales bacterium]|nr:glycosyltransferase [Bryobacterales bacterium]